MSAGRVGQARSVTPDDITAEFVTRLVASEFPQWADLALTPVEHQGWDNRTFRLGPAMSSAIPRAIS